MDRLKNRKYVACIIIMFLILIFLKGNTVQALWLGQTGITINVTPGLTGAHFNMSNPGTNAYCIQQGQRLNDYNNDGAMFKVTRQVHISGDEAHWEAINGASATKKDPLNVQMAWIINQGDPGSNHIAGYYSEKQKAIYQIFQSWSDMLGMSGGLAINGGSYTSYFVNESAKYYESWKSQTDAYVNNNTPDIKNMKKEVYKDPSSGKEYIQVGPINLTYNSRYKNATVYNQNGSPVKVKYARYEGNTLRLYDNINDASKSNQNFYIMVDTSENVSTITLKATVTANRQDLSADVWVLQEQSNMGRQNWIVAKGQINNKSTNAEITIGPIEILGNLKIKKIDIDSKKPLAKVGFKLYYKNANKYVESADGNKVATYTSDINKAKEFFTDSNGIVEIKKLKMGEYIIYETKNPNQGYEHITTPVNVKEIQVNKPKNEVTIGNKRKYVDLSGIVWEDIGDGKQTYRNNLYGSEDKLIEGMTVKLLENGNEVMKTTTDKSGKYIFKEVEIDKLSSYYISFTYNGMSYECVPKSLDKANGSKATEGKEREKFNNRFAEIKNGEAIGTNGNKTPIEYNKNDKKYESQIDLGKKETNGKKPYYGVYEKYTITSNTYNAYNGYLNSIKTPDEIRKNDIKEITDINLGIFLREQPNASLIKDLNNVKVSIKGQTHTYNYRERFNNSKVYTEGKELKDLETQIKFQGKYSEMTYSRPLYASDISYEGTDELTVRAIYEIGLINKSTNLKMKVSEIHDYFDSKYELKAIGRKIDKKGYVIDDTSIKRQELSEQNNYKHIQISTNIIIEPQKEEKIYVELEVSKDKIVEILDGNKNIKLDNIAEIGRYGTLDPNGNVYAGIDENSEPGNANPLDPKTYEDDTDKAPGLSLILQKNARKVTGKVFLDNIETSKAPTTIMTGEERKGNGQYDNGEKGIKDVEIKLVYADNPDKVAKIYDESSKTLTKDAIVKTSAEGDFEISGFIPGNYELKYIWGDKEYKVQNYKGTVIDESIWNKNEQNNEWYKTTEPRYSDAVDNYETRQNIDNQTKKVINSNIKTINDYIEGSKLVLKDGAEETMITKMDSKTQDFKVNIEYSNESSDIKEEFEKNPDGSLKLDSEGNLISKEEFKNTLKNVDFGIVERPKQQLNIEKHIKQLKITLPNGEILVDAKVEKGPDGKYHLAEKTPYTVYLPRSNSAEGAIKIEIDQELIEGAKLDVIYEITVRNTSELDYISEGYYKFGNPKENPVKLTPSIIDYLDESLIITDKVTLDKWNKLSLEDKKELFKNGSLDENLKKYIEKLKSIQTHISEKPLKATEETKVELISSRLLSKNDEIILSNKTEIIEIDKTGGRPPIPIPGNFNPLTNEPREPDVDTSEEIIIIPPTGLSNNKIIYIILGISTLGILTSGIILIKKYVLKK